MSAQEIRLPDSTRSKLTEFQRQVRGIKIVEGVCAGVFGLALSWFVVFSTDRFVDTSGWIRAAILVVGSLGFGLFFPLKCHRWIWGTRTMQQVARLVSQRYPALGDQLLGVVELASGGTVPAASQGLAVAAIDQVDTVVRERDLSDAVPQPRSKQWALAAALPVILGIIAVTVVPDAAWNAAGRWLMPWREIDRYTFVQLDELPENLVVAHGEEFPLQARLRDSTQWSPDSGQVLLDNQAAVQSSRSGGQYEFVLPPQTESTALRVRIGDVRETVDVRPVARPELKAMTASIQLPEYLKYTGPLQQDIRGGAVSAVKGSTLAFAAQVTRDLSAATVAGGTAEVKGSQIRSAGHFVDESETLDFSWIDTLGLSARAPFPVNIRAIDDAAPQIACIQDDLQQVILSTDVVTFSLSAGDDFGVHSMGLEWSAVGDPRSDSQPVASRKLVQAGGPEERSLSTQATFCAESDNVRPQSISMRAWAEDYLPDRGRVYSPAFVLHVLTPEDHAIWVAQQLRRWASRADDVYEQELRLHDVNRELRRMDPASLGTAESRQRIQQQAAAERTNGQRLSQLTSQGDQLIAQALRNQEMSVGHLETFAEALEQLKKIADERMPSVADLLSAAAASRPGQPTAESGQSKKPGKKKSSPMAGNDRSRPSGAPKSGKPPQKKTPAVPQLVDRESGFNPDNPREEDESEKQKQSPPGKAKFGLPKTTLQGGPPPPKKPQQNEEQQQKVDEAVEEQADLLAEFEKVREDLQKIMNDLDNSTFVKRLKSASRRQMEMASDLNKTLFKGFGRNSHELDEREHAQTNQIAAREAEESQTIWVIKSDMEAYFSRRKEEKFRLIAQEMDELQVIKRLTALGDRMRSNKTGDSIARVEFWADTLDRWAEELVAPSKCSGCKPCKGGESLPPAVVLEIMRILEGEIDLRDETRAAETARPAEETVRYETLAARLAETQTELRDRTHDVMDDITALPEGRRHFAKELDILQMAAAAMQDAAGLLAAPGTGPDVVAAETEAIELLLQSKRCNPNSGGGGGSSPGGGGGGDTETVALAMHGPGADTSAHIESREVRQATGSTDDSIPTEYRDGLEAFVNAIETGK